MTWAQAQLQGRGAMGMVAVQTIALIPPVAVTLWQGGVPAITILLAALLVVLVWDFAFSALRKRPFEPQGITTAAVFVLFVPVDIPIWHLAVVLSLGCVIGERIFGGRGFSFVAPATVALSLALLSLPDMVMPSQGVAVALACLPGAVLLWATGLLSLHIVIAFVLATGLAFGVTTPPEALALATALAAALLFLVADPTASAVTQSGRVVHGALAGGLVWVFGGFGATPPAPDALVFAALMASLMAPLVDHVVVSIGAARRRRRHG
jgi:Na+-transporting NADH:ubiquinone oxidoreductase subunit B